MSQNVNNDVPGNPYKIIDVSPSPNPTQNSYQPHPNYHDSYSSNQKSTLPNLPFFASPFAPVPVRQKIQTVYQASPQSSYQESSSPQYITSTPVYQSTPQVYRPTPQVYKSNQILRNPQILSQIPQISKNQPVILQPVNVVKIAPQLSGIRPIVQVQTTKPKYIKIIPSKNGYHSSNSIVHPVARKSKLTVTQNYSSIKDDIQSKLSDISTAKSLLLKELTEIDATIKKCEYEKDEALEKLDYQRIRSGSGKSGHSSSSTGG